MSSADNPSIHSQEGGSSSGGGPSNSLSLELDENYFSDSSDLMNLQSTEEIESAIDKCKESILSLPEMSEEKRVLVQRLIQLRLRLQDVKDVELYSDPKKVKIIQSHKFVTQTVQLKISQQSTQLHCDSCACLIWMPVQHWFSCTECGYIAHAYCLNSVKRKCAAIMVIENPNYILKICPEKSLEHQKYSCAECSAGISYSTALCQPHLCDYTGQYYCKDCHWGSLRIIPARVLFNWDLEPRPVSRASKQFLKLMAKKPIINVEAINPHLFKFVEELAIIKKLRMDILVMKEYILSCKDAMELKLLRLLEDRQHFVENAHQYSLQDLIDASNKDLVNYLQPIYDRFSSHITRECLRCRGKGHVCRLCDQPPIIFPFEMSATLCSTCHSVYHRLCLNKRDAVCLKCQTKGPVYSK